MNTKEIFELLPNDLFDKNNFFHTFYNSNFATEDLDNQHLNILLLLNTLNQTNICDVSNFYGVNKNKLFELFCKFFGVELSIPNAVKLFLSFKRNTKCDVNIKNIDVNDLINVKDTDNKRLLSFPYFYQISQSDYVYLVMKMHIYNKNKNFCLGNCYISEIKPNLLLDLIDYKSINVDNILIDALVNEFNYYELYDLQANIKLNDLKTKFITNYDTKKNEFILKGDWFARHDLGFYYNMLYHSSLFDIINKINIDNFDQHAVNDGHDVCDLGCCYGFGIQNINDMYDKYYDIINDNNYCGCSFESYYYKFILNIDSNPEKFIDIDYQGLTKKPHYELRYTHMIICIIKLIFSSDFNKNIIITRLNEYDNKSIFDYVNEILNNTTNK